MSTNASNYSYLPEYDPITWLGIGLAIFANALIAVVPLCCSLYDTYTLHHVRCLSRCAGPCSLLDKVVELSAHVPLHLTCVCGCA